MLNSKVIFLIIFCQIVFFISVKSQTSSYYNKKSYAITNNLYTKDSAIICAELAFIEAKKNNDQFNIIVSYLNKANIYLVQSKYLLANKVLNELYNHNLIQNYDSLHVKSLQLEASAHVKLSDIDKALIALRNANKINLANNSMEVYYTINNTIARIYQENNDLNNAKKYLAQTKEHLPYLKSNATKGKYYHIQANVNGMEGNYNEALRCDSLGIIETKKAKHTLTPFYDNMAMCYSLMNRNDLALKYFMLCIKEDSLAGNINFVADTYKNLSEFMLMQNKVTEANFFANRSLEICKKTKNRLMLMALYKILGQINAKNKKFEEAYTNANLSRRENDTLYNEQKIAKTIEYQTLYDLDKKENDLQLVQEKNKNKTIALFSLIIILGLIIFGAIYTINKNKKIASQKLIIAIAQEKNLLAKEVIAAEERERIRIAADMHDGLGQLLTAAKFNLVGLKEKITSTIGIQNNEILSKSITLIEESIKEIRHVSHNIMPNTLLKFGLASAVKEFVSSIDNERLEINLSAIGLNENLNEEIQMIVYRVIQESVNNIVKHAKADKLDISIINDNDGLNITIEDNGIGFNSNDVENIKGIGLKNMTARINYLKGSLDIDSRPGKGTLIGINIPLQTFNK